MTEGFPARPADDFEVAERRSSQSSVPSAREAYESGGGHPADEPAGPQFFVFRSSDDDGLSIVYRRKNGGYGLIVTDEEE